jgi:hypothetical protein
MTTTQLDTDPSEFDQGSYEDRARTIDFAKALAAGRTLASATAVLLDMESGEDRSAACLGPVEIVAPTVVRVSVRNLTRGHDYELIVVPTATGSPVDVSESHTIIRCPDRQ